MTAPTAQPRSTRSFVKTFVATAALLSSSAVGAWTPSSNHHKPLSRANFIATGAAVVGVVAVASPATAAEVDPALKGTKKDPAYEACLGKCLYECTKPKGVEQKSRQECLPECKQKCATTKEQLMLGTPSKKN